MKSLRQTRVREALAEPLLAIPEALAQVEARLAEQLRAREPLLTEISSYLIGSGGKRVRPSVTLLIFRACGGREVRDIVDVAAALELIHTATLLHDDIIDDSEMRRGKESALRRYGLPRTLVTGDFLFSRAFQLCGRFEEKLINWAAEACVSLTEGEIMQGRLRRAPGVTVDDYLEIISRKTASMFLLGARSAAYLAGASDGVVDAMAQCGFNVGMTFQIVDDLLDVAGTEARVGKPIGIDLRDGNPSLPVVLALQTEPEVARVFQALDPSDGDIHLAIERIRACGVLDQVSALAAEYAARAHENLRSLVPSPERGQLADLVDHLVQRVS